MADQVNSGSAGAGSSTSGSTPAISGNTTSSNGAFTQKAKIPMVGGGGGFSLDSFNQMIGKEDVPDPDEEYENDEGTGELIDPPEATEDAIISQDLGHEDEEQAQDEEPEGGEVQEVTSLEELSKSAKAGAMKAFTKDGKALNLPPDLEIEINVDGEKRRINLREHANVVAGELTVNQRLGKVSSFREQVEQRRQELEQTHGKFQNNIATLLDYVAKGRPDAAICYLADMKGMSPIQMKRQFLQAVVAEAQRFEGKSELEIDNYYLKLENDWRASKEAKQRERGESQKKANQFVEMVTSEIRKENLSPEEFSSAAADLRSSGKLEGLSQREAVDEVIEHALFAKHASMAENALKSVDPKLAGNKKLLDLLLDHTHPNKFTVEEMAAVVREYLGKRQTRIASSLSRKVQQPSQAGAKSEKQNGAGKRPRAYRSQGDLARAFGL